VTELTFVLQRVTFRGSPFLRSAMRNSKYTDILHDLIPLMCPHPPPFPPGPSPSPPSSVTYVHRCIGCRNPNWKSLSKSTRLTYLSVYDIRDRDSESVLFSPPPSETVLTHSCTQDTNPHPPHTHTPHVHVHSTLWFLSRLTRPRSSDE
jgi:hypothetical protein